MIEVLRWGLWMSPIINSFLRPMGQPTWYNQDGAIRTLFAIGHDATESTSAFQSWSLGVFTALLAYDSLRILIWLDHMGLRVATLVNLSFLGMDKLDEKLARFLSPKSTARCIPEGVKRFTTWAPLLIPFYIPRGRDWDVAWEKSGAGHPADVVTLAEFAPELADLRRARLHGGSGHGEFGRVLAGPRPWRPAEVGRPGRLDAEQPRIRRDDRAVGSRDEPDQVARVRPHPAVL